MRLLAIVIVTSVTAALAATLAPTHSAHATTQGPENFVQGIDCQTESLATVAFALPTAEDIRAEIGSLPDQMWIDISLFNNNFAAGSFIGAGPFFALDPESEPVFRWENIVDNERHFYRVNGLFGDEWMEIGSGTFVTPNCDSITEFACNENGTSTVTFVIPEAADLRGATAVEQWLDLSLFNNGFRPGTFLATGPFPPAGATFRWSGIIPAEQHFYRVNGLYDRDAGGLFWSIELSASFFSLDCRALPFPPTPDA